MIPSWNHSRTLRTAVVASHRGSGRSDSGLPGLQPAAVTLIRTGTADLIGLAVLERESPGQARTSRWGLNRSNRLNKAEVRQWQIVMYWLQTSTVSVPIVLHRWRGSDASTEALRSETLVLYPISVTPDAAKWLAWIAIIH